MAAEEKTPPPDVADALRDSVGPFLDSFREFATRLWWFWLLVVAFLLVRLVVFLVQQRRLARSGILDIDRMSGRTFEQYLRTAFVRLGYRVELTKYRGDYGADLVIVKGGEKTAVQAKRYFKNVGVKAVQEAVAAKGYYDADTAMVVTNRFYTAQAKTLARKNNVALWDRDKLQSVLLQTEARDAPAAESPGAAAATAHAEAEAVCATCGAVVSEKVRAYCVEHANRFGGAIYCFPHQRRLRSRSA